LKKLLLINPGHLAAPVWGWLSFPAHLHHLWSALIPHGPVDVVDYHLLYGAPQPAGRIEFLARVRHDLSRRDFDIAGISCWSSLNVTASLAVAKIVRKIRPEARIVVGGYHPSARPQDFPPELFDLTVRGCGIQALRNEMAGDFSEIGSGAECSSPEIVRPRWEGFPYGVTGGAVGLYLSRGCPYNCSFCMEKVMGKRWMALDPVEAADAMTEVVHVTKTRFLQLYDPLFGLNPRWRRVFLDELRKRRRSFGGKTYIWAQVRSDTLNEDDLQKLRSFKLQLAVGLESASAPMLRIMNKTRRPDAYLKRFAEFSDWLDKKKVHHQLFLIFNHPGETPETLDEARSWLLNLLAKKRKSYLTVLGQRYVYFPGAPLDEKWDEMEKVYGTKVLHKTWWLEEDDHHRKASAIIPSSVIEKAGQMERWKDIMLEINDRNLEVASKANLPDVKSFRDQFKLLNQ
jgi:radical SAM superfamily enzyme YgiQ (UPF0313 family)